jgi:hypothetical protein
MMAKKGVEVNMEEGQIRWPCGQRLSLLGGSESLRKK